MSAVFWAQIKDLTRRVEALEKLASTPAPTVEPPAVTGIPATAVEPIKRGPGRPKKQ